MKGFCPNLDIWCPDGPGEIFSKVAIFALTFSHTPMGLKGRVRGLIGASGWTQRTTAPVEMILWGYSALVWKA